MRDTLSSSTEIRNHLNFFNDDAQEGRATGTRGFLKAASYVSRRFAGYGLQQAVRPHFRFLYPLPLRDVQRVTMTLYSPDTLQFRSGADIYPDRGSGSGTLRIESVVIDPGLEDLIPGVTALISKDLDREILKKYASSGINALIIKALPSPAGVDRPVFDVPVVRIAPDAAGRLFPRNVNTSGPVPLPYPIEMEIDIQDRLDGSAVNILALVPGEHPSLRGRLIIVAARLDGYGKMGQVLRTDGSDAGLGAAAVLETGRLVAARRQHGQYLDKSVLFVVLSGSMNNQAGLRYLLKYPLWAKTSVEGVVYLADVGEDTEAVEQVFGEMGYDGTVLNNSATEGEGAATGTFFSRSDFFTAAVQDSVSVRAVRLAERTLAMLFDRGRIGR